MSSSGSAQHMYMQLQSSQGTTQDHHHQYNIIDVDDETEDLDDNDEEYSGSIVSADGEESSDSCWSASAAATSTHAASKNKRRSSGTVSSKLSLSFALSASPAVTGIRKKRKGGKPRKELSKEQITSMFHLPQSQAAKQLNVSLSTLKRRFYELGLGMRWPFPLPAIATAHSPQQTQQYFTIQGNYGASSHPPSDTLVSPAQSSSPYYVNTAVAVPSPLVPLLYQPSPRQISPPMRPSFTTLGAAGTGLMEQQMPSPQLLFASAGAAASRIPSMSVYAHQLQFSHLTSASSSSLQQSLSMMMMMPILSSKDFLSGSSSTSSVRGLNTSPRSVPNINKMDIRFITNQYDVSPVCNSASLALYMQVQGAFGFRGSNSAATAAAAVVSSLF